MTHGLGSSFMPISAGVTESGTTVSLILAFQSVCWLFNHDEQHPSLKQSVEVFWDCWYFGLCSPPKHVAPHEGGPVKRIKGIGRY